MKMIYRKTKEISVFNTPEEAGYRKFVLGVHCSVNYIPLLVKEAMFEGTQYPMLHGIMEGAGSVCLIIAVLPGRCESIQVMVYPTEDNHSKGVRVWKELQIKEYLANLRSVLM